MKILQVILLGLIWSPAFLFIKIGVEVMSPFLLVAGRVGLAALILLVWMRIQKRPLPRDPKIWLHALVAGFFANSLPFLLFAFGELKISASMAGVLNGLTPLATALFAHFSFADERLTPLRMGGIMAGFAGFALLLMPEVMKEGLSGDVWGMVAVGIASVSYGVGIIYGRKYLSRLPRLVAPTCQLTMSALCLIPLIFLAPIEFSWAGIGAVMGLGVLCTAGAFILYYRILEHSGAAYLSMCGYLFPLFGTIWGALFLGERLPPEAYFAGILILFGMYLVNKKPLTKAIS